MFLNVLFVSRQVGVTNHLQYLDETHAIFPCGHNTVIMNTETREQVLIHGGHPFLDGDDNIGSSKWSPFQGVTALALSPNRRTIAIAERGSVGLYDSKTLRRRRLLQYSGDLGSKEIYSVSFSADSKQVITVGAEPDWTVILWTTDRTAKVVATMKFGAPSFGMVSSNLTEPSWFV
jgi:cilia- and flagella-associated protein 57